MIKRF